MAPRAIASGTISLRAGLDPGQALHRRRSRRACPSTCCTPRTSRALKQQYVCPTCGEVVERDDMVARLRVRQGPVRGASPTRSSRRSTRRATSRSRSRSSCRSPRSTRSTSRRRYLLGPDKGGEKRVPPPARGDARRTGAAPSPVLDARGRQQLVLLRPAQDGLMLHALYYADEVRDFGEIEHGDEVTVEARRARSRGAADRAARHERVRRRRSTRTSTASAHSRLIERKVAGKEITSAGARGEGQIIDLMDALKESLAAQGRQAGARRRERGRGDGRRAKGGRPRHRGARARASEPPRRTPGRGHGVDRPELIAAPHRRRRADARPVRRRACARWCAAGWCHPARDGRVRFSFQDLVVLRTARELLRPACRRARAPRAPRAAAPAAGRPAALGPAHRRRRRPRRGARRRPASGSRRPGQTQFAFDRRRAGAAAPRCRAPSARRGRPRPAPSRASRPTEWFERRPSTSRTTTREGAPPTNAP